MSRAKRRVGEASNQSAVVPFAAGAPTQVELVSPATWEEIPELLLVKMQKEDAEEVAEAMVSLRGLISSTNENCKEASRLGAPSLVVMAMRKFQYINNVQQWGCGCLQTLSSLESLETITTIAKAGGMEAVINALKIFPDSAGVLLGGFRMLVNVFDDLKVAVIKDSCKRFVNDLDGLTLAVAAMGKFPESADLQGTCCELFAKVAQEGEFHASLNASGALRAAQAALDKSSEQEDSNRAAMVNSESGRRGGRRKTFTWADRMVQLTDYKKEFGHIAVRTKRRDPSFKLGLWLAAQRSLYRKNSLHKERLQDLRDLGCLGFGGPADKE